MAFHPDSEWGMVRYYFNVRRDDTVFEDKVGAMLPGAAEAWTRAIKVALALKREGWVNSSEHRFWIEVCDEQHCAIMSFPIGRVTMQ